MNDIYLEIDPKNKKILSPPKELELNWNNIGGLCFLDEDKLIDLSWAGHANTGFIKFIATNKNAIRCFDCSDEIIEKIKLQLIEKLSNIRYHYECGGITVNNQYSLNTDDRSKLLMQMKYLYCKTNLNHNFKWKTSSGEVTFFSEEFIKIFDKIVEFIQRCFELELEMSKKINLCDNIISLCQINLNAIEWNFNTILL
jgi:hypothetical protein